MHFVGWKGCDGLLRRRWAFGRQELGEWAKTGMEWYRTYKGLGHYRAFGEVPEMGATPSSMDMSRH